MDEQAPWKILIIEDDADTRALLKEILRKAGYAVTDVETGEEGLFEFRSRRPDLVILDVGLPGIDGWEVLRRIKTGPLSRKVPVILLTARDQDADKLKGYDYGADYYVTKPCDMEKLVLLVRAMLVKSGDEE